MISVEEEESYMSSRHRWGPSVEKGYVKCLKCGLEVRKSDRLRGGLGPCERDRWKLKVNPPDDVSPIVECSECHKIIPNTVICAYCGAQLHPLNWSMGDS